MPNNLDIIETVTVVLLWLALVAMVHATVFAVDSGAVKARTQTRLAITVADARPESYAGKEL
jgi:hypothetical protein